MPRIPGVSQKDAVRVFQKLGFKIARESGHIVMSNGEIRLTIPRHNPINSLTMGCWLNARTIPQLALKP